MIRKIVHYSGRVQGVGFRYSVSRIARGFTVSGYVINLPDGRVEVVAEGERVEVKRFLDEVDERMVDYIQDVAIDELAASGEFAGFSIKR